MKGRLEFRNVSEWGAGWYLLLVTLPLRSPAPELYAVRRGAASAWADIVGSR
jgi:hypothetical protein